MPKDSVPASEGFKAISIDSTGSVVNADLSEPDFTDASTESPDESKAMETGTEGSTESNVKMEEPGPIQVPMPNIPIEIEKEGK